MCEPGAGENATPGQRSGRRQSEKGRAENMLSPKISTDRRLGLTGAVKIAMLRSSAVSGLLTELAVSAIQDDFGGLYRNSVYE